MKFKGIKLFIVSLFLACLSNNTIATIVDGSIDTGSEVDYWDIYMGAASELIINVFAIGFNGSNLDSYIYLFDTDTSGTLVGVNDDCAGCDGWDADGSLGGSDSLLTVNLAVGHYVLAIGDWVLTEGDARDGFNDSAANNVGIGAYQLTITGEGLRSVNSVPAPGSLLLLAVGLIGVGTIRLRNKLA